ncbi:hypothetical protein BGZ95_007439 [Linnemannia exigua]|uniref:Myb-like domain-containing protein n=1 Tax=Linnemannia exigua TaxID=604196 RepID=A0AAD4DF38_9FUNG|nr:hypothetical protein BGZ95_007439 [Linnemannia exigua]
MSRSKYASRQKPSTPKSSCGKGNRRDRGISDWRKDWLVVKESLKRKFAKVSSLQSKRPRTVASHTSCSLRDDEDDESSFSSLSSDSDAEDDGDDDDGSVSSMSYTSPSSDLSGSLTPSTPSDDDEDEYSDGDRAVSASKPSVKSGQRQVGTKRLMTKTLAIIPRASKVATSTLDSRIRRVEQPPPTTPSTPAVPPRTPSKRASRQRSRPTSPTTQSQPPRSRPPRQIRLKTGRWTKAEDQALYQGVVEYLAQHGLEPKPPGDLPLEKDLKLEKKVEKSEELDEKGMVVETETLVLQSLLVDYDAAGEWEAGDDVAGDSTKATAAYHQVGDGQAIYNQENICDGDSLTPDHDNDFQLFDELVDVSGNALQAGNRDDEPFLSETGEVLHHHKAMLTSTHRNGSSFIDQTPCILSDLTAQDYFLPCMAENVVASTLAPERNVSLSQQQQQQQQNPRQLQLSSHQEHLTYYHRHQQQQLLYHLHRHLYQQHHQPIQLRQYYQHQLQPQKQVQHQQQLQLQQQPQLSQQQQHPTLQWSFPILSHIDPTRSTENEELTVGGTNNYLQSTQEHSQYNEHSFHQLQRLSIENLSQLVLEHQYQCQYPNLQLHHQQHGQHQYQLRMQQQFHQQQQIQQQQQQQQQRELHMYCSKDKDFNLNASSLSDYHHFQPLANRHSDNNRNLNPARIVTSLSFWKEKQEEKEEKTPLMPIAQDAGGKMWFTQGGEGEEGGRGKEHEGGRFSMTSSSCSNSSSPESISGSEGFYTASAGSKMQMRNTTPPAAATGKGDEAESVVAEMMLLDSLLADSIPPPPPPPLTTSSSSSSQGHGPPHSELNNKDTTPTPQETTSSSVHSTHDSYTSAISRLLHIAPWSHIATSCVPGRTGVQAQARYSEALDPLVKKGPWSAEEDALLLEGAVRNQKCWIWIADGIRGRTQRQCRTRWVQLTVEQERKAAEAIA